MGLIFEEDCPLPDIEVVYRRETLNVWATELFIFSITILVQYLAALGTHMLLRHFLPVGSPYLRNASPGQPLNAGQRRIMTLVATMLPKFAIAYIAFPLAWDMFGDLYDWSEENSVSFSHMCTIYLAMYTFDLVFRDCNPLLALHHMLVFLLVFVGQQMREYTSKDALLSRAFLPMLMPGICITDAAGDICQLLYRLPPLTPANPVPGVAIHMLSSLQLVLRIVQWWLMLAYRQRYNDQIADALEYGINWVLYGALMLFVYMEFQDVLIYSTWRPALTIRQTNAAARRLRETQVEASVELASMLGEPLEEFDEVRRNEMMELINAARAESLAFRNGTIAPENRRFLESSYALLNEFDGIAFQDGRQTTPRRPRTKNPDPSAFPNPYGNQPDFTPSRLRPPWSATRQYYNQIDNNQPIQFQQTKTPMSQRRSRRGGDSGRSLPPPYSEAPSAIRNMSMMQQQQQQAFSPYKGLVIPTTPKTPTPSKSGGRRSRTKAITFDDSNPF